MELIRLLLLEQEIGEYPPELEDYSEEDVLYNYRLMGDSGLIDAEFIPELGVPQHVSVRRLTWAGHDFLDATRDYKIWQKAKEHIIKTGASWTFQTLLDYLKREINQRLLGGGSAHP